jgi:flagellar hook protein FlgE
MGFKSIMGSLSPVYGAVTGEGMMGKMLNPAEAAKIAQEEQARQQAAAEQANADRQAKIAASTSGGMKKGGKVSSASSRADGIAQRGKTRGKIV